MLWCKIWARRVLPATVTLIIQDSSITLPKVIPLIGVFNNNVNIILG